MDIYVCIDVQDGSLSPSRAPLVCYCFVLIFILLTKVTLGARKTGALMDKETEDINIAGAVSVIGLVDGRREST